MFLIGLHGRARSGKDTTARLIYELSEDPVSRHALAGPLKKAAAKLFSLTESQLYGDQKEVVDPYWGATPRKIMQLLGTEALRNTFGQDMHLRILARKLLNDPSPIAVITDVRFENEAEFVLLRGGIVVEILRPEGVMVEQHASEVPLPRHLVTKTILNDGSIEDLKERVNELLKEYKDEIPSTCVRSDFGDSIGAESRNSG